MLVLYSQHRSRRMVTQIPRLTGILYIPVWACSCLSQNADGAAVPDAATSVAFESTDTGVARVSLRRDPSIPNRFRLCYRRRRTVGGRFDDR